MSRKKIPKVRAPEAQVTKKRRGNPLARDVMRGWRDTRFAGSPNVNRVAAARARPVGDRLEMVVELLAGLAWVG